MTKAEWKQLKVGDIVTHRESGAPYVVAGLLDKGRVALCVVIIEDEPDLWERQQPVVDGTPWWGRR